MILNHNILSDFNQARHYEWLETNGLGGYASASVCGANTRRYHGLLVAALNPPAERTIVVSKLDETLILDDDWVELSVNQFPGVIHPAGHQFLKTFRRDLFPEFVYEVKGVVLKKTIAAIQGKNTTLVLYEVLDAPQAFVIELQPFYAYRDFHSLSRANDYIGEPYIFDKGVFQTMNYQGAAEFFIKVPQSTFTEAKTWYYNFEYFKEQERGFDFKEDLYTHGKFSVTLKKGSKLGVIISLEDPRTKDPFKLFQAEEKRRIKLTEGFIWNDQLKRLVLASDQFIVARQQENTIVAGYHWFMDWGRDTMISLPGLCLSTGRTQEAKKILKKFSSFISDGMLPCRFPDAGELPDYNTIDAALWFFNAVYFYFNATQDKAFVKSLWPVLVDIVQWYVNGTRYNIQVDSQDGLLKGGQDGVQLTWMDAKVGDWVVTPRRGKAVEINALWYNALRIMENFASLLGKSDEKTAYEMNAAKVKESFMQTFWNEARGCLYDFVDGNYHNDDIRPNQIFALSLPFPVLERKYGEKVMEVIDQYLLTPRGLRSLSPDHPSYKGSYTGDVWARDGAYHQGTVWAYLAGAYIDGLFYVGRNRLESVHYLNQVLENLDEACIGSLSEIFEANSPFRAEGCIAQAWSVAEVLRVALQYDLLSKNIVPEKKLAELKA
jgi:predicted glycogen debranching enzyme